MNKNYLLFLLYLLAALFLYPFLKYYVDSADTLQYITIAENYAEGNFADAVNSFWSPLITWLLIPFILSGMEAVFAFKILQIIIGLFTLKLIFNLIAQSSPEALVQVVLKIASAFLVLGFALLFSTPDLLMLTCYLWFVTLLKNNRPPLLLGICGAVMYLTKGFGFALFIIACAGAFIYKVWSGQTGKKKAIAALVKTYSIFFLLCSPWIYLISVKEGNFIFSSAGTNALYLINPAINPNPFDEIHYHFEKGVLSEPPEHAFTAWIYPHRLTTSEWSPFESSEDFLHYLKTVFRNILSVRSFYFGADAGTILILAMVLIFAFGKTKLKTMFRENAFLIITCLITTALYILLVTIDRYLWINDIAIIALFGASVQKLLEWKRPAGIIFLAAFSVLLLYFPARSIVKNINAYKDIYVAADELKNKFHFGGNIASLTDSLPDKNHRLSHLVAYYAGARYYGMANEGNASELEKYKIDFILDWNVSGTGWPRKSTLIRKEISLPQTGLTVYQISNR